jgi:hypothetical protein
MARRWLAVVTLLVFAATLAVVIGMRLMSSGLMAIVFGLATGVVAGTLSGLAMGWWLLRSKGGGVRPGAMMDSDDAGQHTSIVLTSEQADRLLRMLSSREQASPADFPLVADRERRFTLVGGAHLEDTSEE